MKIYLQEKQETKKENMFSDPVHKSPKKMFSKIFSLRQISPSSLDKLTLFAGEGNSFSKKRSVNVQLSFHIKDFYKLLKMKNLPRGRTSSREATPLGDPRGVPKQFSTFWSFSKNFPKRSTKHFSKSLPICLEGFGNRSKHSSQSVIQRIEVNDLVNILALKTSPSHMRIHLNLKMESTENPILVDLIDFFNHTNFSGVEGTTVNLNELLESSDSDSELQDNSNTVTSSQPSDDFRYSEVQSSFVDSSVNETQQEFEMNPVESQQHLAPLPSFSTNQDVISSVQIQDNVHQTPTPTPMPHFQQIPTVSIPAQPQQSPPPPPQLVQVVADNSQLLSALPGPAGTLNISPSTSPSSRSTLSSPPSTEYIEMRRRNANNVASRNYRGRKKEKEELADKELKKLKIKNELLKEKLEDMLSRVKEMRAKEKQKHELLEKKVKEMESEIKEMRAKEKQKNELLENKVKEMESDIKETRAKAITNITQPRVRKRERSSDLDDNGPSRKQKK